MANIELIYSSVAWAFNHPRVTVAGLDPGTLVTATDDPGITNPITIARLAGESGKVVFDLFPFIQQYVHADFEDDNLCHTIDRVRYVSALEITVGEGEDAETYTPEITYCWGSAGVDELNPLNPAEVTAYENMPWTFDVTGSTFERYTLADLGVVGDVGTVTIGGKTVTVHVDRDTCGVYLRWLNHRGELLYHLFRKTGVVYNTNRTPLLQKPLPAVEYDNYRWQGGDGQVDKTDYDESWVLGVSNAQAYDLKNLVTLLPSNYVDMYMGNNRWQRVRVEAANYEPSGGTLQDFEVTIHVPTPNPIAG